MKVLGRRVLVRREATADKLDSLYIPETAKRRPQEATVVAVGPEVTTVSPGMRVLIGRYAGVEIGKGGDTLIWERDVLGILEE